jgi:hypothetical protein
MLLTYHALLQIYVGYIRWSGTDFRRSARDQHDDGRADAYTQWDLQGLCNPFQPLMAGLTEASDNGYKNLALLLDTQVINLKLFLWKLYHQHCLQSMNLKLFSWKLSTIFFGSKSET